MNTKQLIDDYKYLFGTYSVMALTNIRTILLHIQKSVGLKGKSADKDYENFYSHQVIQYLNPNPKEGDNEKRLPEKTETIIRLLKKYFPFLEIMAVSMNNAGNKTKYDSKKQGAKTQNTINEQKDIYFTLYDLFYVLKKYRNISCHQYFLDNQKNNDLARKCESKIASKIDKYYTAVLREIKDKYGYTIEQLSFIKENRYRNNGKEINKDFFLSMVYGAPYERHLSGVGVVLLISLFLEKKYINEFLDKLPIYQGYQSGSEEYIIIKRSLSQHCIKLPRERFNPEKKDITIAMDMLNELKKCPKELYETLAQEKQNRFKTISSQHNEVLFVRSTDRFVQLALQYIDYTKRFKNIRFHVNMGKLRFLFSPCKSCIDGQERVRVLEHPLNGYGRIQEIEKLRKNNGKFYNTNIPIKGFEEMERDCADNNQYPYIVDTYTQYILKNNKVEFYFCNENKYIVPYVNKDSNGKWYVNKTIPSCRISFFEIPAMIFHMYLCGSRRTEKLITEVYNNYMNLFEALKNGTLTKDNIHSFNIHKSDIPQKVLDSVDGITKGKNYGNFVKNTLEDLYKDTQKRKKEINSILSQKNKIGTKGFKKISTGKLADFLAKDIVRFQPTLCSGDSYGTDRLTGLNYRIMQAAIATYKKEDSTSMFNEFKKMFYKAGLLNDVAEGGHPFLDKALAKESGDTVDFYKNYLNEREIYLKKLIDVSEYEKVELPFINKDRNKWLSRDKDFYKILGEIYIENETIELPRQMFDNEIKEILRSNYPTMKDVDYDKANVTYLIAEFMKRELKDDFQEFYSWERNYRYIDMLKGICDTNGNLCRQYTTTEERERIWKNRDKHMKEYSNNYQKSEKTIRRYKIQDMLMFLMAENILKETIDFKTEHFKLKDIMPDTEKGILSTKISFDFIYEKGNIKRTIHADSIKLKDYGEFFVLANDYRIKSLFEILLTNIVDKDKISEEFAQYDMCRPEMIKMILEFEKCVFEKYPDILEEAKKNIGNPNYKFDFKEILKELDSKNVLEENDKLVMSQIRNAFSHNVYPEKNVVEVTTLPQIARYLISSFDKHTKIDKN